MLNDIVGGFGVSNNASILQSDVGLGVVKLQSSESSPFTMMTHDHRRPFLSMYETVGDGGGSTCSNSGAKEGAVVRPMTMSHIYNPDDATTGGGSVVTTQQPFHTGFTPITTHNPFKSPGKGMAVTLGCPFTLVQWKELQRQATIYNCLSSSVPFPPHLISPITGDFYAQSDPTLLSGDSNFNLRFLGNEDPEPGRCRRTDGKKWRCSRDVVHNHKYCERHMHRGRPRSRKHVEADHSSVPLIKEQVNNTTTTTTSTTTTTNKKSRLNHPPNLTTPPPVPVSKHVVHTNYPSPLGSTIQPHDTPFFFDKSISASSSKKPSRSLDWTLESKATMGTPGHQLQQLMQTNGIKLSSECSIYNSSDHPFQPVYRDEFTRRKNEPLSLFPYTDFGKPVADQRNNESSSLFLQPDNLVSFEEKPRIETSRAAWSNENLSPCSLTLTMGQIQMALGGTDYRSGGSDKPQLSNWMSPLSWGDSTPPTPGGPLAEALRPTSVITGGRSPVSPYASNGDSIGTPATTISSSPSGILHRTMLSFSDSSGCNSPTLAAARAATPEFINFDWSS